MGNSLRLVLFGFFYVSFSIIYATIDHLVWRIASVSTHAWKLAFFVRFPANTVPKSSETPDVSESMLEGW